MVNPDKEGRLEHHDLRKNDSVEIDKPNANVEI